MELLSFVNLAGQLTKLLYYQLGGVHGSAKTLPVHPAPHALLLVAALGHSPFLDLNYAVVFGKADLGHQMFAASRMRIPA